MKIGEFIRTKEGCIFQIIGQSKRVDHTLYDTDNFGICSSTVLKEITKKHSPNIIDLIEEGDYVNGYKVFQKEGTLLTTKGDGINRSGYIIPISQYGEDIKSIVTKEQFEQMKYIVGDE